MTEKANTDRAKVYALIALLVFAISRIIYSAPLLFILTPVVVVCLFERRNISSLGFRFDSSKIILTLGITLLGFLGQAILLWASVNVRHVLFSEPLTLSPPTDLLDELIGQLFLVGVPEEIYYRGYLMTRLGDWLGKREGYYLSALLFGFGHIWSRLSMHGFEYFGPALIIGISTFVSGLIFGYMLLRTKSLYPPILAHIATNMFASRLVLAVM